MVDLKPLLAALFPKRFAAYQRAKLSQRYYKAATGTDMRPLKGGAFSADAVMEHAEDKLRQQARYLDENHDIVVGIFDSLLDNVVGEGVKIEPMVRTSGGELHEDLNDELREAWAEWAEYPEVSGDFSFPSAERMLARSWLRDGEVLVKEIVSRRFNYRTPIPFALELMEGDYLPHGYTDTTKGIVQGIQKNGWGAPVAYHLLKTHPGDSASYYGTGYAVDTRRVSADQIHHLKFVRRLRQARGVPVLHAVIQRLTDIFEYEESERIAARVAAEMTGFIERTSEFNGITTDADDGRQLQMSAGMIFELNPGEKVGTIGHDRPNSGLEAFREAMLRAVASGTGTRFSSIARNYNGTYSAQRQELVEGAIGTRALFAYLRSRLYKPVWRQFVRQAFFSGVLTPQADIDMRSLFRAEFRPPALPWIDPAKEAKAFETLINNSLESRAEIQRQRGRDPRKVREEIEAEREQYPAMNPQGAEDQTEPETDQDENGQEEEGRNLRAFK